MRARRSETDDVVRVGPSFREERFERAVRRVGGGRKIAREHRDGEVFLHMYWGGVQPRRERGTRLRIERPGAILDEPGARLLGDGGPHLLVACGHFVHLSRAMRRRQWPSAWARYFLTICVEIPRRSAISW